MNIRTATIDDARLLMEHLKHIQQVHIEGRPDIFAPFDEDAMVEYLKGLIQVPNLHFFIYEVGGDAVAYAQVRIIESAKSMFKRLERRIEIDQIAVLPDHRSKGYGEVLTNYVINFAKSLDIDKILLSVWSFNVGAKRFYERLGFEERHIMMELTV